MSNADFQQRLQRLGANPPQEFHTDMPAQTEKSAARKMNLGLLFTGALLLVGAGQAVKYVNENYETLKETYGVGVAAGSGLGVLTCLVIGVVIMFKALPKKGSAQSQTGKTNARKMNLGLLFTGALLLVGAGQAIEYVNENYETLKETYGVGVAAGSGLGVLACLVIGVVIMFKALPKKGSAQYAKTVEVEKRQAPRWAVVFFSLLGFGFGVAACMFMFLAASARYIDTEIAQTFSLGGFAIVFFLAALSLLFGFVGMFMRRRGIGRVPVYFIFGAILTFAAMKLSSPDIHNWQILMDLK